MIIFNCSHCGVQLQVGEEMAGASAPCPDCENTITAPYPEQNVELPEELVVPTAIVESAVESPASEVKSNEVLEGQASGGGESSAQPRWMRGPLLWILLFAAIILGIVVFLLKQGDDEKSAEEKPSVHVREPAMNSEKIAATAIEPVKVESNVTRVSPEEESKGSPEAKVNDEPVAVTPEEELGTLESESKLEPGESPEGAFPDFHPPVIDEE